MPWPLSLFQWGCTHTGIQNIHSYRCTHMHSGKPPHVCTHEHTFKLVCTACTYTHMYAQVHTHTHTHRFLHGHGLKVDAFSISRPMPWHLRKQSLLLHQHFPEKSQTLIFLPLAMHPVGVHPLGVHGSMNINLPVLLCCDSRGPGEPMTQDNSLSHPLFTCNLFISHTEGFFSISVTTLSCHSLLWISLGGIHFKRACQLWRYPPGEPPHAHFSFSLSTHYILYLPVCLMPSLPQSFGNLHSGVSASQFSPPPHHVTQGLMSAKLGRHLPIARGEVMALPHWHYTKVVP